MMKTAHCRAGDGAGAMLIVLVVAWSACGTDTIEHAPPDAAVVERDGAILGDAGGDATPRPDGAAGRMIAIYVEGDTTSSPPADGLSGQTPKAYTMSLGRFEILRAADDPAPVLVFDHADQPVEVDMLGRTLAGTASLGDLPAGTYSHGQVLLTSSTFTVAAVFHAGVAVPGEIEAVVALSKTTIGGSTWSSGEARFTFKAGPIEHTIPFVLPVLPSTGGGTVVQEGGQTLLRFPFPTPIVIGPTAKEDWTGTITFAVNNSFRWQDQQEPGYQPGVFDVNAASLSFEPVMSFGATGYSVAID